MTTTATDAQAERPLITRSRAELERAVIEAARQITVRDARYPMWNWPLRKAIADLDEWERLRAEAESEVVE